MARKRSFKHSFLELSECPSTHTHRGAGEDLIKRQAAQDFFVDSYNIPLSAETEVFYFFFFSFQALLMSVEF